MIFLLARDPLTYFQSYKNYFVAIYLIFLAFPVAGLILIFTPQSTFQQIGIQGIATSGALIAIIWGYVATKLFVYPEPLSPRRFFSRPFRRIFLAYALYLIPMIFTLVDVWSGQGVAPVSIMSTYPVDNVALPLAAISSSLVVIGVAVVVVFTVYPLAALTRRSALVRDKDVRHSLKVIAISFGVISATLVVGFGSLSYGLNILGPTNLFSVALIIVAVQAFRKPTFLKAFLEVVPSLESSPNASHYDQVILLHGHGDNKFAPIAKYIVEGINQRERVIYFHSGDVTMVADGLSREGIDATRTMLTGAFRVLPLASAYPKRGLFDETPLQAVHQLLTEAKTLGSEGLRIVLDYDDFSIRPVQKFVDHLMDPKWTTADHQLHALMVLDSAAFRGEEAFLSRLEKKIRTVDMAETKDSFSREIGLPREEIIGRKLLVQYDPQGDYASLLGSLLVETASNFERTVLFTRKDSPLYSLARRQPGTKIFVLTSRVSYPRMESDNLFLLPSYDTSLVLDAINRTIEAYTGTSFTIVFDNISHFIFTIGPERTYSLIRQALELMISNKITGVFSMNSKAHDQKTIATFENMFDLEITCEAGTHAPEVRRKITVPR
jgi:hypothetical protein